MTVRVGRVVATAILMTTVVTACGSGDSVTASSLLLTPTTTSTSTTTTSTMPPLPELALEAPAAIVAAVGSDHGGPMVAETYCETNPRRVGDTGLLVDPDIEAMFGFMGVERGQGNDCDVAIGVHLESVRLAADYYTVGECFTGYTLQGFVSASVGDQEWRWDVDVRHEPPEQINGCGRWEEPPGGPLPRLVLLAPLRHPLGEIFGPLGEVAYAIGGVGRIPVEDEPPDPEVYEVLAGALHSGDKDYICRTLNIVSNLHFDLGFNEGKGIPVDHPVRGLVPHVIHAYLELASADQLDQGCWYSDFDRRLSDLTGEDLDGPRAWAEWWTTEGSN
jgi:hypothetical protein